MSTFSNLNLDPYSLSSLGDYQSLPTITDPFSHAWASDPFDPSSGEGLLPLVTGESPQPTPEDPMLVPLANAANLNTDWNSQPPFMPQAVGYVEVHESPVHSVATPLTKPSGHTCKFCDKGHRSHAALIRHERVHTGERPYECNQCDKTFAQKKNLKAHMRVHTGERPYECNECERAFATKSGLKAHMPVHTGERPYECNICFQSYRHSAGISWHCRAEHGGKRLYKCSVCDQTFEDKKELNAHEKANTVERPFICPVEGCNSKFKTWQHLDRHRVTHTKERAHKCHQCDKTYTLKDSLVRHIKKKHKEGIPQTSVQNRARGAV